MPEQYDNQYESPEHADPPRKGMGCWFWGCLISLLVVVLVVVGGGFGVYFVAKSQINKYTSAEPAELPVVEGTEEEVAEIQQRVEQLNAAPQAGANAGGGAGEVMLTADDINKLIASDPQMKGRVFVTIEEDQLQGEVSIPTDFLPIGQGRFINAKAKFEVKFVDGQLVVKLRDAEVKGERLPQQFLDALADQNLAEDLGSKPETAERLRRFESIEVRDGKLILRLKQGAQPKPQAP